MLRQAGFSVKAVAFEREYHTGRMPECPVELLGEIAHGHYLQRILRMVKALPAMRRAFRHIDVIYAFGQDVALLSLIAGIGLGKPVVVEVGDINPLQVAAGLKGRIIRRIDKCVTNAYSLLVATAPRYVDIYYRQWLNASVPALVIENKLEASFAEEAVLAETAMPLIGRPLADRPLRIGYFGLLRCDWSWQILEALAVTRPQDVEIVLAGYPMNPGNLPEQVEQHDNMKYLGQYRSPRDLPSLYNSVDLVWACYRPIGPNDWNSRWARPNRFYESCLFKKPIVSRYGCSDSMEVDRYNIGLTIVDEDVKAATDTLCNIKTEDLVTWTKNISKVPREDYIYTTEAEELADALRGLVKEDGTQQSLVIKRGIMGTEAILEASEDGKRRMVKVNPGV